MLRNKLVRSDGSIIDSSVIISCEFTEEVNSGENLSVGDVTSSEIMVEVRSTDIVEQNEVLTYYIIEDGVETLIGVFNAEKPTVASRTSVKFSAYDNIVKSEKIFSEWLRNNQGTFPMTLGELVVKACEYCNLTLATASFPQSGIEVNAFYADGITCRQILAWAGAIAGRFVRANSSGEIEFAWYKDASDAIVGPSKSIASNAISVTDDGAGNVNVMSDMATVQDDGAGNVSVDLPAVKVLYNNGAVSLAAEGTIPYKQGSLSYEGYTTDRIERVQIKQSDDDVGVIYPQEATGNCFVISGNMILSTCSIEVVTLVATRLYEQLGTISYVPATVTLLRTIAIRAGDIINIRDPYDTVISTYVMKVSVTPSGTTISSTGDKSYESNAAVSSEKYDNLTGKILSIKKDFEGLRIKNESLDGKVSGLELSTEEFKTYVNSTFVSGESFEEYKSESVQTAKDITAKFESLDQFRNETQANIKTGLLDQNEDGSQVFGIEVGQRNTSADGVETFNKFARFTSDRLSFYDADDTEVAYISDYKLGITQAKVFGNLELGQYILDTSNGLALRWVKEG